jgi:hypothetical protein
MSEMLDLKFEVSGVLRIFMNLVENLIFALVGSTKNDSPLISFKVLFG